jgi:subtilisin family serine protease
VCSSDLAHLEFAELDRQVQPTGTANDPYFGSAWHLAKIGAPTAWDTAQGSGVTVAVIDTGVDGSHPDLSARMVPGWNFWDGNADASDVKGHGTGVAGAVAATTNNGLGVAAVSGQSRIMPIRATDTGGIGYVSLIAQGIGWAADNGAKVVNLSFDRLWTFSSVTSAAQYAKNKGTLVVIAASNNAMDEGSTSQTATIPVSATDRNDALTSFSSWGNHVAVAAPGLDIWSTTRGGGYGAWWGTSVASPVTAGVVALMMSANPSISHLQVESLLYATATDLGTAGRDKVFGWGRVDAARAVAAAAAAVAPSPDTQPPAVAITSPAASQTVSGLTTVTVAASDDTGVAKVELRVDGNLLATDTASPFAFTWDTRRQASGMASLEARAWDAAGNAASSAVVAVNVANAADTTPPIVGIGNPADGSKVSGTVQVSVSGGDNAGVAGLRLELFVGSRLVASATGTASLSYNWNTRKLASGAYTLSARATDAAGNFATTSVTVTR